MSSDILIRGKRVASDEFVLQPVEESVPSAAARRAGMYQTPFPAPEQEPFHRIKDQMRRLSSDHFNSHLAFGVSAE